MNNRMKKESGTMKIFMTGGTGFVGTFLADQEEALNHIIMH